MSEQKMPGMPGLKDSDSAHASVESLAPENGGVSNDAPSSQEGLGVPSHEEKSERPEYDNPDSTMKSDVNVPLAPKKGIEVVATRKGFYKQDRIKEGDKFFVKDFKQLGEWMKCVDPALEKERVKALKEKKEKAKL